MDGDDFRTQLGQQRAAAQNRDAMNAAMLHAKPYDPTPSNIEKSTRAAAATKDLMEQLVAAQAELLAAQVETDTREVKMLFWTRVAGVGAIAALAVSIIAIVVTLLVA